jgi:hypothetical protein
MRIFPPAAAVRRGKSTDSPEDEPQIAVNRSSLLPRLLLSLLTALHVSL